MSANTFNSNTRRSGGSGPDYSKIIGEVNNTLTGKINTLDARVIEIEKKTVSLYFLDEDFSSGSEVTIGGTDQPGATNIFNATNKPALLNTAVSAEWVSEIVNTNNSLFGQLKYLGSKPLTVQVDLSITLYSPNNGGVGYNVKSMVDLNGTPLNTVSGDGLYASKNASPILLSLTPHSKIQSGNKSYSFTIRYGDIISARWNCDNASAVSAFKVFETQLLLSYLTTVNA